MLHVYLNIYIDLHIHIYLHTYIHNVYEIKNDMHSYSYRLFIFALWESSYMMIEKGKIALHTPSLFLSSQQSSECQS